VYRVAYEAIIRARQSRGATLLECFAHPDTSIPARENVTDSSGELPPPTDPVSSMGNYLKRKGIEPEQHNREIVAAFNRDLELAIRFLDP
jgi:TPP-dependent pyruvate/acetoin dehydrogenase alpha subunit